MLARGQRLRKNKQIEEVFKRGQGRRGQFFYLKCLKTNQPTLVNVVVGAKVSKKSVVRHKIKRQTLAAIKPFLAKIRPGRYSFVAQAAVVGQTMTAIKEDINNLLSEKNNYQPIRVADRALSKNTLAR